MSDGFVVVDTDVASAIFAGRPMAQAYADRLTGFYRALSFASVAELTCWALERNWGPRRTRDLEEYILEQFTVLPYRMAVALTWADLVATCRRAGYTPGQNDAWIAATAVHFDCPVMTADRGLLRIAGHYPALTVLQ